MCKGEYEVELLSAVEVTAIEPEMGNVTVTLGNGQELCAHAALIATGSRYRQLGVPGEASLTGAGVHYCATCDGPFYRGAEEILVVGGGNSALEEALFLTQFAKSGLIRTPSSSAMPCIWTNAAL